MHHKRCSFRRIENNKCYKHRICLLHQYYFKMTCFNRWVKFEEDVEEGGERWSKPHVATLSLHSLFELRSFLLNGTVILDMDATSLEQIADLLLDNMVNQGQLTYEGRMKVILSCKRFWTVCYILNSQQMWWCKLCERAFLNRCFCWCLLSSSIYVC